MPPNELTQQLDTKPVQAQETSEAADSGAYGKFMKELALSVVYSAVEQPALGVAQVFSNDAMRSVKNTFSAVGIDAPRHADFNTSEWYAQNIGSGIGMIVPFALTKMGLGKIGAFGKATAVESSLLSRKTAIGLTLKESAITGGVYGAAFTPSDERARDAGLGAFVLDRGISGVGSAAAFSMMTAGSLGMGALAKTASVERIGLASAIKNPVVVGAFSGLPGGAFSVQYDSVVRRQRFATVQEMTESMFGMAVGGAVLGGAAYLHRPSLALGNPRESVAGNEGKFWSTSDRSKSDNGENLMPDAAQKAESSARVVPDAESTSRVVPEKVEPSTAHRAIEPPVEIRINEFKTGSDQNVRAPLSEPEQILWRDIQEARTPEQWKRINEQIDDLPLDKGSWFSDTLERHSANLSVAELNAIWPRLLENDPHQVYRLAKHIGSEKATAIWAQQLESVKQSGDAFQADQLSKTAVFVEPGKQLQALNELLNLPEPPGHVSMLSVMLAKENQLPAAKMLAEKGIVPQIETSHVAASKWADWALGMDSGTVRDGVLEQVRRKIIGSTKDAAAELNEVYKVSQDRVGPQDYENFNKMLTGITPKTNNADGTAIRTTALEGVDPKFISRMMFPEGEWSKSDQIAAQNPELIKALAINSRFNPNFERSAYIAELMTRRPPVSAEQLTQSLIERAQKADEGGRPFNMSEGDVRALLEHGVKVAPHEVQPILSSLQAEVLKTFDLRGEQPINRERLLTSLTLAHQLAKHNPEAFDQVFRSPLEATLENPKFPYERRLEASRALGELQRGGYEAAAALRMPELRMTRLAELTPEAQVRMRNMLEDALYDKDKLRALLGDGEFGRLLPEIFGHASEGGIVGRQQHQTHDYSLDNHLLSVVDKIAKDPDFQKLLPKDQVNLLWGGFLHDIGKRENMIDFDHNRMSTSMAWGILRTLGYSDARIQRITDIMSKDAELSYEPDALNSVKLSDPKELDNIVNSYRHSDALDMVAILNRSDIKSVKDGEAWYTEPVIAELNKIQDMAKVRVDEINRHLLPILPSELPQGFGAHQMSNYGVYGHSSYNLGQLLKQRSTVESPEYSMSVSLFTPENRKVYSDGSQEIALLNGPFEHIAQANRANLSTGNQVGWDGHVRLVDQWSTDHRARALALEAEAKLEQIGIPEARNVAPENFPRLNHLRRILAQFESLDELTRAAQDNNDPYVQGARAITDLLTSERDGSPLRTNNEIKLNNPVVSGLGLLRQGNQPIFFEGLTQADLNALWGGNVPSFVSAGPPGSAPTGALKVSPTFIESARKNNLPIVVLNDSMQQP